MWLRFAAEGDALVCMPLVLTSAIPVGSPVDKDGKHGCLLGGALLQNGIYAPIMMMVAYESWVMLPNN